VNTPRAAFYQTWNLRKTVYDSIMLDLGNIKSETVYKTIGEDWVIGKVFVYDSMFEDVLTLTPYGKQLMEEVALEVLSININSYGN